MQQLKPLTNSQTKYLRGISHGLNPVITIGNQGITESLMLELESSLDHHEILKIKMTSTDRSERKRMIEQVIQETNCNLIQSIGKIIVIFRPNKVSDIELPN